MAEFAQLAKYGNTYGGKDKVMRFAQYAGRALQHWLLQGDPKDATGLVLKDMMKTISLHRKFFRFGRLFDDYAKSRKALMDVFAPEDKSSSDATAIAKRGLTLVRVVAMGIFVAHDHCIWLIRSNISPKWMVPIEASISARSLKFRVASDVSGLLGSFIDIRAAAAKCEVLRRTNSLELAAAEKKRKELNIEAFKFVTDILTYMPQVPALAWTGLSNQKGFHDGWIGLAGTISSIISARKEWEAVAPKK